MSERYESAPVGDYMEEAEAEAHFEEFEDGFEEDGAEEDGFTASVVGGAGQSPHNLDQIDQWDQMADLGSDNWDQNDAVDSAVADALASDNQDEFIGKLRNIGRAIGKVARVVAPIAGAIPLPFTQVVAQAANMAGKLLADGADEFEAMDSLADQLDQLDNLDAAAPVVAALALRRTMPRVGQLPRATRQQLVRGVTQATRTLARTQGAQGVRAVPRIVQNAQRSVRQRRIPARALPRAVLQTANRVAQNTAAVNRLANSLRSTARSYPAGQAGYAGGQAGYAGGHTSAHQAVQGGACPHCGGSGGMRTVYVRGPARIIVNR